MMSPIAFYQHAKNLALLMIGFWENAKKPTFTFDPSPLIPRLRFFQNMAPHSNDSPYYLLPSCKKLETFNERFGRKCPKSQFLTLTPLTHELRFFQNSGRVTFFTLLSLLLYYLHEFGASCKVSEKNNEQSRRYLETDGQEWLL